VEIIIKLFRIQEISRNFILTQINVVLHALNHFGYICKVVAKSDY